MVHAKSGVLNPETCSKKTSAHPIDMRNKHGRTRAGMLFIALLLGGCGKPETQASDKPSEALSIAKIIELETNSYTSWGGGSLPVIDDLVRVSSDFSVRYPEWGVSTEEEIRLKLCVEVTKKQPSDTAVAHVSINADETRWIAREGTCRM